MISSEGQKQASVVQGGPLPVILVFLYGGK